MDDFADCCPELVSCGCKAGCTTKRCKCVCANLACRPTAIVRENVAEKTTLNSFQSDSETNYTASYSRTVLLRVLVHVRQKQQHKTKKNMGVGQFVGASGFG